MTHDHCAHCEFDLVAAFQLYEKSRITRTARVVLSAREMGRIYHAKGVERLVRNSLWKDRRPEQFYDALDWLYGWTTASCLAKYGGLRLEKSLDPPSVTPVVIRWDDRYLLRVRP